MISPFSGFLQVSCFAISSYPLFLSVHLHLLTVPAPRGLSAVSACISLSKESMMSSCGSGILPVELFFLLESCFSFSFSVFPFQLFDAFSVLVSSPLSL